MSFIGNSLQLQSLMFIHSTWPGPPQNPNTFSGKREPMFVKRFSKLLLRLYTHFPKIFHDFYPIFYPFDPCFGILLGRGSKWDQIYRFLFCKIHPFGRHIPMFLIMWSSSPSALVGAPKYLWFHFMVWIVMRISQPIYDKNVGKGHLFENSYVKSPPPTQVVGPWFWTRYEIWYKCTG